MTIISTMLAFKLYFYNYLLCKPSNSITFKENSMRVRTALNVICRQLSEPRYWVIRELKKPGVLWDKTKKEVLYDLSFYSYIPFDSNRKRLRPPGAVSLPQSARSNTKSH